MPRHLVLLLLLVACGRSKAEPVVTPDPVTVPSPPPVDFGAPGPVAIVPPVPALETGMMDHADLFGWSSDGALFGYCQTDGGMGARHCQLAPRNGPIDTFDDIDRKTNDIDPKRTAAIAARMKKLALTVQPAHWAYARDLEITWQRIDGDPMITPPTRGQLRIGIRVRGEPTAHLIDISGSSEWHSSVHPEAIAVSSDGKVLGVISHAYGGEFTDELSVRVVPIAKAAVDAYEAAARAHDGKDATRAAMYRARARAVAP